MINPIKIMIHDFPKVFPVTINNFVRTFSNLNLKMFFYFNSKSLSQTIAKAYAFVSFGIKDKTEITTDSSLNAGISTKAKGDSFHVVSSEAKMNLMFQTAPHIEIKSYNKLTAIVAIFLKWTDRKLEIWEDVKDLTSRDFILREIK